MPRDPFKRNEEESEEVTKLRRIRSIGKRRQERPGDIPKSVIAGYLPTAPIIVEGGAHVGQDTLEMSLEWPKGKIHSFEPVPDLFHQLERATRRQTNVTCYPFALSARQGSQKLYLSGGASRGSSSLRRPLEHLAIHPEVSFESTTTVPVLSLDDWVETHNIDRVDFLWLDVQGNELDVLKGAHRLLPSISALHIEVSLVETYEGVPLYPEIRGWLTRRGFRVAVEALPWPDMGNVLFVR